MVNFFNRIVVSVLLAGLVVLTVYALAITLGIVQPDATLLGPLLSKYFAEPKGWTGTKWWIGFGILLGSATALTYLILWEFRSGRTRREPFTVEISTAGIVTVEQRAVIQLVEQAVKALPQVRSVKVDVRATRSHDVPTPIRFVCRVSAVSSADLPELGQQVQEVTRARVEEQLGLQVVEVIARIDFDAVRIDRRVLD